MRGFSLIQTSTTAAIAAAVVLSLTLFHGCGPGPPQFDSATLYTPETLASELASRYQILAPDAKTSTRKIKSNAETEKIAAQRDSNEKSRKKGVTSVVPEKKAKAATVDDLLDDIDNKLSLIKGTSRADACRKMIDTFSSNSSLSANDKKGLTELVGKLADKH